MSAIELEPSLTCCIETEAKRAYREALRKLLAAEGDYPQLTERVELLRLFLESTDFRQLRTEYEKHLLAGKKVKVTICMERGEPRYRAEVISP